MAGNANGQRVRVSAARDSADCEQCEELTRQAHTHRPPRSSWLVQLPRGGLETTLTLRPLIFETRARVVRVYR